MPSRSHRLLLVSIAAFTLAASAPRPPVATDEFFDPIERDLHGFTVHVDPALLDGPHATEGRRALSMLANHLERITILAPPVRLRELRELEIWLERRHPDLNNMQYHPSKRWLTGRGFDPRLAKKVHIPRAATLLSPAQMWKHPMVVLHELAHAYHDQVLGFDDPRIVAAYQRAADSGDYERVLDHRGETVRHYGLSNPKVYFAESTEAYFGRNDFFPFVPGELRHHDPTMNSLLREIWGPVGR